MKSRSTSKSTGQSTKRSLKRQRSPGQKLDEDALSSVSNDTDDEQIKVRIGRVPYHWYDEFAHFGYDNKLSKV
jgi:hypothetical protein